MLVNKLFIIFITFIPFIPIYISNPIYEIHLYQCKCNIFFLCRYDEPICHCVLKETILILHFECGFRHQILVNFTLVSSLG